MRASLSDLQLRTGNFYRFLEISIGRYPDLQGNFLESWSKQQKDQNEHVKIYFGELRVGVQVQALLSHLRLKAISNLRIISKGKIKSVVRN